METKKLTESQKTMIKEKCFMDIHNAALNQQKAFGVTYEEGFETATRALFVICEAMLNE